MRFALLFVRITCAKLAFIAGLGIAPAVASPLAPAHATTAQTPPAV
jgi:hypothetical protein